MKKENNNNSVCLMCRKLINLLERELSLTPWNLTANFIGAREGKFKLTLTGWGDPSNGRGEAFSYIK
jgi:hypothetical protein